MARKTLLGWLDQQTNSTVQTDEHGETRAREDEDLHGTSPGHVARGRLTEARGDDPETVPRLDDMGTKQRGDD